MIDEWDLRYLLTILNKLICKEALEENYLFSECSEYLIP